MKFTEEQFKEILDGDKGIYMDDLPFETQGLEFFNALPDHLQGEAMQWGFSDTCVREDLFEFLIENQFGMSVKEYYASGILDKYFETKIPIPIDYKYLKMSKKERLKEKLESKHSNVSYENKEKRTSFDETFGQDKMDLANKVIGDKSAELLEKLQPVDMKIAAQTIGLDLVEVKPGGSRIDCVSPTFVYSNPGVILFEKDYHGFEDMFDLDRDMSEIMQFDNRDKIPSEFSGIVRVLVEYYPSNEDLEELKNK